MEKKIFSRIENKSTVSLAYDYAHKLFLFDYSTGWGQTARTKTQAILLAIELDRGGIIMSDFALERLVEFEPF